MLFRSLRDFPGSYRAGSAYYRPRRFWTKIGYQGANLDAGMVDHHRSDYSLVSLFRPLVGVVLRCYPRSPTASASWLQEMASYLDSHHLLSSWRRSWLVDF